VRQTDISDPQSFPAPGFIDGDIQVVFPSLTLESAHHRGIDLGPGSRLRRRRRPDGKTTHVWPDPDLRSSGSFDGALEFLRQLLMVRFAPEEGDRFWLALTAQGTDREDQKSGKSRF
jgi:hypothetical protein